MTSTDGQNGQAQPSITTEPSTRPRLNHRLSRAVQPRALIKGNGEKEKASSIPVLDEGLEENDLRLSVHVKLNGRTESLADLMMERMIPEGKTEENRWVLLKAVEDLIATACQGTLLKLEAKLGAAPKLEPVGEDEHDLRSNAGVELNQSPDVEPHR